MSDDRHAVWIGPVAVVPLPAEVDLSNADQVRQHLAAVTARGASLVIADMSATTFCDSAGVMALILAVRRANASGTGLRVAASTPGVTRVLAITGVDRLIETYPSVAAAIADNGTAAAYQDRAARPGPAGQAGPTGSPRSQADLPAPGPP